MSSISSVGASSYVPQAQNDEILRKIPRGASSQVAQAPATRPGSAGAPGGYGGGSAFAAQVIGQAPVSSTPSTGGGSAPVGGTTPTGPSTSPGPTAPTSNSYSMQSGDGFDLLTSTTVAGGGPWGGDFTLTDNGRGGIDITMGPGFGNQMSIQRGQSFDGTTDASGTDLQPTYDAQTVNAGDTVVIDTGGFAQYAIGNIQKDADGSITFSEKQLNGPDYYGNASTPAGANAPGMQGANAQDANGQDANGQDASSQASSMQATSMRSNSVPADSGTPTMDSADAALVSSVISETSGGEATSGADTLARMQAQSAAMQSYFAAQVYAANMTMAAVSGGSVVSDGSGGSTVSTAGGGGSSGTSAAGGGGGGSAAGGGGSSSAATTSSASSGGSSAGSSTASTSS